jgi:Na+-transporting methylmalonyl-CoA/oxaloacetate decarboxylase gamma subunit
MDESWVPLLVVLALVVIVIAVMGGIVGRAAMRAHAIKHKARSDAENGLRYQELAELCAASQQQAAAELSRLGERVAAIEKLLRDVG